MSKPLFRRSDTILFLLFVLGFDILTLLQLNGTFFIFSLGQLILGFSLAIVVAYSLIKIIKDKRPLTFFKKMQPLLLGLCLVATIPFVFYLVNTDGGKRTVIEASSGGDLTFVKLDLRDDGSFKLLNSGPFGGKIYRGHYTLKNDTLRIDNGDKNLYPSLVFVVKYSAVKQKKCFYPVPIDTTKLSAYELYIQTNTRIFE